MRQIELFAPEVKDTQGLVQTLRELADMLELGQLVVTRGSVVFYPINAPDKYGSSLRLSAQLHFQHNKI